MKNVIALLILTFFSCVSYAGVKPADSTQTIPSAIKSVTKHSIVLNGKTINYTATAGALILRNEKDEPIALFGYVAYTKDGESDLSKRPVTFAYNGGPGSSSMWLHIGILGPEKVVVNDPDVTPPPPYKIESNANSILDVTDLVIIDPVGTGLSHAIGKAKNTDFWGVDQDIKSVSEFIRQYTTDNDRWNSPKFLLGESYGTTRSAGVADYLQENMGMTMNGIILVSIVLDFHTLDFSQGDDLSYILYLPTYAAVAWYHNKLTDKPSDLNAFLEKARSFAGGEYANALMKGDAISDSEKEDIAGKLSSFTGLSKDYILKANLRVSEPQFTKELLRQDHETVGRLDARYTGVSQDLLGEFARFDPQSSAIEPAFTAAFMNYYYGELKVDKKYAYHTNAYGAEGFKWDMKHNKNGGGEGTPPNTAVDLAEAMSRNPDLKVLAFNGYFDLATPFYGTEYTFDHMGLEKKLRQNITMKYFNAGHMMYVEPASATEFKNNVSAFIQSSIKQ